MEYYTFTHLREWNKSIVRTSPYVVTLDTELEADQDSLHGTPEGASLYFSKVLVALIVTILFCYKLRKMQHSHKS